MAEGTTLRIAVESTGTGTGGNAAEQPPGGSGKDTPIVSDSFPEKGKTFNDIKREQDEWLKKFREDQANWRKKQEPPPPVQPQVDPRVKERRERQQQRDEDWYDRYQLRQERIKRAGEDRQSKDEDWLNRQETQKARKRAKQQEKDEDWYDADVAKQRKENQMRDPRFLAQRMMEMEELKKRTRAEYDRMTHNKHGFAHEMGQQVLQLAGQRVVSQMSGVSAIAAPVRTIVSRTIEFAKTLPTLVKGLGVLGAVAGVAALAWRKSVHTMLEESRRVERFSPHLISQNVVNNLRDIATDMRIASQYGESMARTSDRENRRENAWRVIGTAISSVVEHAVEATGIPELYTKILEGLAGIGTKSTEDVLKQIAANTGQTLDELKKAGIKGSVASALQAALSVSQQAVRMIGGQGAEGKSDPVGEFIDKFDSGRDEFVWLNPRVGNPGIIPNVMNNINFAVQ